MSNRASHPRISPSLVLLLLGILATGWTGSGTALAATSKSPIALPVEAADRFVDQLSRGDVQAFELIVQHWISPDDGSVIADRARAQWKGTELSFRLQAGARLEGQWERLGTRQLGQSVVKFIYLLKYERGVVPVSIGFYRATDQWAIGGLFLAEAARDDLQSMERRTEDVPEPLCTSVDAVVAALSRGQMTSAAGAIRGLWFDAADAASALTGLEHRLQSGRVLQELQMGKCLPGQYERLGVTAHGRSLRQFVYLVKHEHGFTPWTFRFYRARERWALSGFASGSDVPSAVLTLVANAPSG